MAGFDNPLETWNARFAREDFLFGEEPNAFLRTQANWLRPGGSVLGVADGEGRNSVWLAEQGFRVTAFDTGGLPRREHMYTRDWLQSTFSGWEILLLEDYDAVIQEGQAHNGMSALIDLVASKS